MLKKLLLCFAALFLCVGLWAEDDNEEPAEEPKITKKERKAAKKAEKAKAEKKDGEGASSAEAIPGLPPDATNWHRGPNMTWEINFNKAVEKAKAEKKQLFVLSSGSDWCPPCKKLKTVVTGTKFRKIAKDNFVLVFIDAPRMTKLPATQLEHNAMVKKKFNFGGGVPSVLIIDPATLKIVGKIGGYRPSKEYIKEVQKYAKNKSKDKAKSKSKKSKKSKSAQQSEITE